MQKRDSPLRSCSKSRLSSRAGVSTLSPLERAHTAAHTRKQGVFQMVGAITTLGVCCALRNPCARSGQKSILCHLCVDRGNVGEKQRAFGTATRPVGGARAKAPPPPPGVLGVVLPSGRAPPPRGGGGGSPPPPRPRRVALLRCWLLATPVSFAVCHRCDEVQRENC